MSGLSQEILELYSQCILFQQIYNYDKVLPRAHLSHHIVPMVLQECGVSFIFIQGLLLFLRYPKVFLRSLFPLGFFWTSKFTHFPIPANFTRLGSSLQNASSRVITGFTGGAFLRHNAVDLSASTLCVFVIGVQGRRGRLDATYSSVLPCNTNHQAARIDQSSWNKIHRFFGTALFRFIEEMEIFQIGTECTSRLSGDDFPAEANPFT